MLLLNLVLKTLNFIAGARKMQLEKREITVQALTSNITLDLSIFKWQYLD